MWQRADVHLFGDSLMRALAFSVARQLNSSIDDTDSNLKEAVVPDEHSDTCGGNRRYENHMACASKMGFAIRAGGNTPQIFSKLPDIQPTTLPTLQVLVWHSTSFFTSTTAPRSRQCFRRSVSSHA